MSEMQKFVIYAFWMNVFCHGLGLEEAWLDA